ncbi:Protein of unknown function [Cotesia congregata]|uniref:Uncharacterized protein n=1 Tax=Cotesia congregata TaxID=51543 RepID=A0A8J2H415_COTCN|nr:Protein of unknown function [Cotesia congregata]
MDYDDFFVAWSCEDYGNYHIEKSWVFSREPAHPCNIEQVKRDAFAKFNLTKPKMIRSKFANCDSIFCSYDFS